MRRARAFTVNAAGTSKLNSPHPNGLLAADPAVTSDTVSDGTQGISERENGTSPPLPLLPPPPAPPMPPPAQQWPGESESSVASEEKVDEESDAPDAD